MALEQEDLKKLVDYTPEGRLVWKGTLIDAVDKVDSREYSKIIIDNISYSLHRLVWMYHNGRTTRDIGFKNKDRKDTRIQNLRIISYTEIQNARRQYKKNNAKLIETRKENNGGVA